MKSVAVVLSGCGFKDGAEITEAVSTLIHLSQLGVNYKIFAPNEDFPTTNHKNDSKAESNRNALDESARIARGDIHELTALKESDFDAVIFPGGYGAALNLCTWGKEGSGCKVLLSVEQTLNDFHQASKPIGAWCIAPALVAKVLGSHEITVTIGNDAETAQEIEKTGAIHEDCKVTDFVTDRAHKIVTTPAYMYEAQPHQVFAGIGAATKELFEMA